MYGKKEFVMKKKPVKKLAETASSKPIKLGEAAGWLRRNPNGLGVTINDWRAVMK
jgi:hypothetical protein